jgi:catecholate siderophore receptor
MSPSLNPAPFPAAPGAGLRTLISRLLVGTGSSLLVAIPLQAAETIEEILITDRQRDSYLLEQSTLTKFTEPLKDTPQTITTLSAQLLDDRAAMSLNDALRNVPGITLGAGEFSWQGNNPNIRGFSSRNDMFLDGLRDFGSYDRDPFNLQSIEVMQGPSSMVFGRGSTGGVINQASKTPFDESLRALHVNIGNAATRRVTVDVNEPLTERVAARLNLMKHEGGIPARDGAHADRYGIAPSLSVQLGSATALTLSYMKQASENIPDYGLPWLAGKPADVERSNFYGFESDYIDTDADISTIRLDHELGSDTRLQALVRYADYQRQTRITEPLLPGSVTASTPLETVMVNRNVFTGESTERMLQGQLNLVSKFSTGALEHALVAGVEAGRESSAPGFGFGLGVPPTSLLNPAAEAFSSTGIARRLLSDSDADSIAAFVLDTVKLGDHWQVMAGLRRDRFEIDYRASRFDDAGAALGNEQIVRTDIKTSYRAALVYKPVEAGTVYLGWGTSFNPSSEGLSFVNSGRNLTIGDAYLGPENNRSVELGTKWELRNGGLTVDAALFNIVKSNARVPDPANPGFNILAGEQTVNGFSFSASGRLNQYLALNGGYTWLDSEQGRTTQLTVAPGTPLANVPEHAYSLWLTWDPVANLQLSGGARYIDARLATITQPVKQVPDYWAFDAMVKYQVSDALSLKLNLTNLTDEYYFDQLHPFHVIPGPGFASVFAVNLDY